MCGTYENDQRENTDGRYNFTVTLTVISNVIFILIVCVILERLFSGNLGKSVTYKRYAKQYDLSRTNM